MSDLAVVALVGWLSAGVFLACWLIVQIGGADQLKAANDRADSEAERADTAEETVDTMTALLRVVFKEAAGPEGADVLKFERRAR